MTTAFSRELSPEESIFSRLTNLRDALALSLRNQKSSTRKLNYRRRNVFSWLDQMRVSSTRFCSTPPLLIWQSYVFSNVNMRIDRSAGFPTGIC